MSSISKASYTVADKYFYEPLDRYIPDKLAFFEPARQILPEGWNIVRKGIWFHCVPQKSMLPPQGWKIHVSATDKNAQDILAQVIPILVKHHAPFKFALDRRMLSIMTGKNWDRGGSGKFITIYPANDGQFREMIEDLHQATADLKGPYILSDRRYKTSKVVYYRYGGLLPIERVTAKGDKDLLITSPDGASVPDQRNPHFVLPPWVKDPFEIPENNAFDQPQKTLNNGRYLVVAALAFSNSGGVYRAKDLHTGSTVVIKEGRPCVNLTPAGDDAVVLLEKEYRLLKKIAHFKIAPRPIDFFTDWEHAYLAEEYLEDVIPLRHYAASRTIVLSTSPTLEEVNKFWSDYKRIFARIGEMLAILHENGIVFMDLSLNNIMVSEDHQTLKFIDFEGAFEPETDAPTYIFTPGFVSIPDLNAARPGVESDFYALGALMLGYIMPVNGMLGLDPQANIRFLRAICRDFGLPSAFMDLIVSLLAAEKMKRPKPREAVAMLQQMPSCSEPFLTPLSDTRTESDLAMKRTIEHVLRVAAYNRTDRLFPSDPKVFVTNPLSIAYGACGVAYMLKTVTGEVDERITTWIRQQTIDLSHYPPGLYLGTAGIAWALSALDLKEEAVQVLRSTRDHPLLRDSADLFYGLAGWGLTQLRFFLQTNSEEYLAQAVSAGRRLKEMANEENGLSYWPMPNGDVYFGFAHGASGISLFLLYLFLVTHDEEFLQLGRNALAFDLAAGIDNGKHGITWPMHRSPKTTMLPYLRYGTAGVGLAASRYYRLLGDTVYEKVLDEMFPDINRKYAIFPGRFLGLAGIGEFLLDLAEISRYRSRAEGALQRVLAGLAIFQIETEQGLAFPGYELFRLSCDVATGSAGIALFFHRYLTRCAPHFLLDELFKGYGQGDK